VAYRAFVMEAERPRKRRYTFWLDEELYERMRKAVRKEGRVFVSEFVRSAILDKLKELRV